MRYILQQTSGPTCAALLAAHILLQVLRERLRLELAAVALRGGGVAIAEGEQCGVAADRGAGMSSGMRAGRSARESDMLDRPEQLMTCKAEPTTPCNSARRTYSRHRKLGNADVSY